jgi:competence protein ComEC
VSPVRITAILLGSSLLGAFAATIGPSQDTRLTFLSVGQGDCAVFQTQGRTILIDVGPKTRYGDAGKRIVVPSLRRLGVDAVDLVLLSHPDADHTGGLSALLSSIRVGSVAIPAGFREDQTMLDELREAGCPDSKVLWLDPEQQAEVGDFRVSVECPTWHEGDPDNDGSDFVKISNGKASVVFTGDASSRTEQMMLPLEDWSAQILKLGHHGSHTATGDAWLDEVKPVWAVVSCGRSNPYGHPHRDVLERLERRGTKIARTDREGDITFTVGPNGWTRIR